jgi:glycosyltransferase involved in cell wall biosynthesis
MKVLGLCSHPVESPATRYRLSQFISPLAARGIDLTISPFINSDTFKSLRKTESGLLLKAASIVPPILSRLGEIFRLGKYDLLFVQREAMFFGPAFFESLFQTAGGLPMVLDLDDATYIRHTSPTFGKLSNALKNPRKADRLIARAAIVTCGNRFISEYIEDSGRPAIIIPTVANTDEFKPLEEGKKNNAVPVIGWIGTSGTFPFLRELVPVLQDLAKKHRFVLRNVGAETDTLEAEGLEIENVPWELEREIADFQQLDIGLYPLFQGETVTMDFIKGKSGFKAIQYLAVGVPFVMSPVGVCAEIGEPGRTHFNANSKQDWYNALDKLLSDADLRKRMGASGREYSLRHYLLSDQVDALAGVFEKVLRGKGSPDQAARQS